MTNIIQLYNAVQIPEVMKRTGYIKLNFNVENADDIEIVGTITVSEACYLKETLTKWIHDNMDG